MSECGTKEQWLQDGDIIRTTEGKAWHVKHARGSGTCCQVYEAHQVNGNQRVAIKCYKNGAKYQAAHDREALLLSLLAETPQAPCKQLVTVVDDCCHEGRACLIQELLDVSLRQLVIVNQNDGRLSLHLIQKFARDVIRGLLHMHKSGFVHGDVKPANVLWSQNDEVFKLVDFGLSFHVADKACGRLQSARYRAPEVADWNTRVQQQQEEDDAENGANITATSPLPGTAADIWSVGCMLLEMFNGQKTDVDAMGMMNGLDSGRGLALNTRDKDGDNAVVLTTLLENLIRRMLEVDTTKRITSRDACNHEFFQHATVPSHVDLLLLPSSVLRFLRLADNKNLQTAAMFSDLEEAITDECTKYGKVEACRIPTHGKGCGNVFVKFSEAHKAVEAFTHLCRRTFDNHTVLMTYFPLNSFLTEKFF